MIMTTTTLRLFLLSLLVLLQFNALSQDFITRWELPTNLLYIEFTLERGVGGVDYYWETIPAGTSGSGNFPEGNGYVSITGLPANSTIRLSLAPENLKRFYQVITNDYLVDVEAWGTANWSSMEMAFRMCDNLQITATDVPDLSSVTNLSYMFRDCINLNGPANINTWNTSNVTTMYGMFEFASAFNQPLNSWNTGNVANMSLMFSYATSFDQPLSNWNMSNATNIGGMFQNTLFNQPIGNWNTNNVENMAMMFLSNSSFNQNISTWNTSSLNSIAYMFYGATTFNQPIGNWNTSGITSMNGVFFNATDFNQDISNWNTTNVIYMSNMFRFASSFNQNINSWDVSNVEDAFYMFLNAENFNQSLGSWNLNSAQEITGMLMNSGMDCDNYSSTLVGWSQNPNIANDLLFEANGLEYSPIAAAYRAQLINDKGWTISGDVEGSVNCSLELSENEITKVICSPNPVYDILKIDSDYSITNLILTNVLGNVILQMIPSNETSYLDLSSLTGGYYILSAMNLNSTISRTKILKL